MSPRPAPSERQSWEQMSLDLGLTEAKSPTTCPTVPMSTATASVRPLRSVEQDWAPLGAEVRCGHCNKLLAQEITPPWVIRCTRCKATNVARITVNEYVLVAEPSRGDQPS